MKLKLSTLFLGAAAMLSSCGAPQDVKSEKSEMRAPAYPLVMIDPYTSAWSFTDNLYDGPVKHWTGKDFPFLGVAKVDGQIYRFMGTANHHALYDLGYTRTTMALNKEKQDREVEQNSETTSQFGLQAATRLHEVGIASNRGSACHGEYVPGPCTHRPSHHESRGDPKSVV